MGCGASAKIGSTSDPFQNLSGKVEVFLKSAIIYQHQPWYGGIIEAYVVFRFGKTSFKSQGSSIQGLQPDWRQKIEFQKGSEDELILVEIWNDHPLIDDIFIGSTTISLLNIKHGGNMKLQAPILDERLQNNGLLFLEISFECKFPSNPIAQQIDSAGFLSLKLQVAQIDLYYGVPELEMSVIAFVSLNDNQKGFSPVILSDCSNYNLDSEIIFYRDMGEESIRISLYDCGKQAIFELIGSAFISVSRSLVQKDVRKVVLWKQGRRVGTIQLELQFDKSPILFNYCMDSKLESINTNEAFELKKQGFQDYFQRMIEQVKSVTKACNRPQLELEQKAIDQVTEDLQLPETPQQGTHTLKYQDGSEYVGEFHDHLRHGYGKLTAFQGKFIYEGNWIKDMFHGKGFLITNTIKYEGEFVFGIFNGKGKHSFQIGQEIEIKSLGSFDGEQRIISQEKCIFEAKFEKGVFVEVKKYFSNQECWIEAIKELTADQLKIFRNNSTSLVAQTSSFLFLRPGLRIQSGRLFSSNFKYCLLLTNRGTLKKIQILPPSIETWNNRFSDPNSRPFFFWINLASKKFEIVGYQEIIYSIGLPLSLNVIRLLKQQLTFFIQKLNNSLVKVTNEGELFIEDLDTHETFKILVD